MYWNVTGEFVELSMLAYDGKIGDLRRKKKRDQHADPPTEVFGEASEVARVVSSSHLQSYVALSQEDIAGLCLSVYIF